MRDDSGLSGKTLTAITSIVTRGRQSELSYTCEKSCENIDKDWSDMATNQGMLVAPRIWKSKE